MRILISAFSLYFSVSAFALAECRQTIMQLETTNPSEPARRAWVKANHDDFLDYCRVVSGYRLQCTFSTGPLLSDKYCGETITSKILDRGFQEGAAWVDVNGDGLADYCRLTGNTAREVTCTFLRATGAGKTEFGDEVTIPIDDPGYDWSQESGSILIAMGELTFVG